MSTTGDQTQVRITIDLDVDLHREMKRWAAGSGGRVTLARVYRALSSELLSNPSLADAVRARTSR